jgi:hypothetical protein
LKRKKEGFPFLLFCFGVVALFVLADRERDKWAKLLFDAVLSFSNVKEKLRLLSCSSDSTKKQEPKQLRFDSFYIFVRAFFSQEKLSLFLFSQFLISIFS